MIPLKLVSSIVCITNRSVIERFTVHVLSLCAILIMRTQTCNCVSKFFCKYSQFGVLRTLVEYVRWNTFIKLLMMDTDPNSTTIMDSIFDSVEDEDVEDHDYDDINHQLLVLVLVKLLWLAPVTIPRREKWSHQRLSWLLHVAKLQHEEGEFERTYHMSLRAYNKLLDLLRDSITLDHSKAGGSDLILPELVVAIGLRWLAGGSYIDIRHAYGCSITSMFRLRTLFIDAILECDSLNIVFPDHTTEKIIEDSLQFRAISTDGIMRGCCIGAIDGLLAVTIRPSLLECGFNPGAYFPGHYMTFALNVQAVCNHDSRFIFFGVMAPGKCSD